MLNQIKLLGTAVYLGANKVGQIYKDAFKSVPQVRKYDTHWINGKKAYGIHPSVIDFLFKIDITEIRIPLLGRTGGTLKCPMWKIREKGLFSGDKKVLEEDNFTMIDQRQSTIFDFMGKDGSAKEEEED